MRVSKLFLLAIFSVAGCAGGVRFEAPALQSGANPPAAVSHGQVTDGPVMEAASGRQEPAQDPEVADGLPVPAEKGTGALRINVRWPAGYRAQAIPLSTNRINVLVTASNASTTSAVIQSGQTEAVVSGLVVGSYSITLSAARADKTVVATAVGQVQVKTNETVAAHLVMIPSRQPHIAGITAWSGSPGSPVAIFGSNLNDVGAATFSVLVNGEALPSAYYDAQDDSRIVISGFPGGVTTAKILVSVDGISAPAEDEQTYTIVVIDHVALVPTSLNMAPGETKSFVATAYSDAEETQPLALEPAEFDWQFLSVTPGDNNPQVLSLVNGFVTADASISTIITATVKATAGGKSATGTVTVTP